MICGGGSDFLTYESFGRNVLETGSLQGGEDIFYHQPLFRYLVFVEHLLFGEGDGYILVIALLLMNFGILWLSAKLFPVGLRGLSWWILLGATGFFLLILANSSNVDKFFHDAVSEFPTWVILPYMIGLLFVFNGQGQWTIGTLLKGHSFLFRTNHAPALVLGFLAFVIKANIGKIRMVVHCTFLLGFVVFLPLLHNLYYGGKLVFLPTSAAVSDALVLPPRAFFEGLDDPSILNLAWHKFRWLVDFRRPKGGFAGVSIAVHGLQFVWGMAIVKAILSRRSVSGFAKVLLAVPMLHLLVQFFYIMFLYLSRHVIMANLAMGVTALVTWSQVMPNGKNPIKSRK